MENAMTINFLHEKIRRDMAKHYAETGDDWALGVLADIPGWIARTGAPEYLGGAAYRQKQRRTIAMIDEMRARIRKMDPECP
jgi:hypothetical protein